MCQLLAPDWPEHGPVGMKTGRPQAFWGQCRGGGLGAAASLSPRGYFLQGSGAGSPPSGCHQEHRRRGPEGLQTPDSPSLQF